MKTLFVYADFDFLDAIELIGELSYERIRGNDSYAFKYSEEWLKKHSDIILSEDLNNYQGWQYPLSDKDIFACFSDALPDRWGRTLLNRREQLIAIQEKRPIRHLSSFDYLTGIDDYSRMGAFRFKEEEDGDFINMDNHFKTTPLTQLRELLNACWELEKSELNNELPNQKWLHQLVQPGSSLGGARPKASVIDEYNQLYIAKFPSRNDDYDIALWEHFAHLLAKSCGVNVAETKLLAINKKHHTLLSKRFDRVKAQKRIHFASAMTMLGLEDGANAQTGNGYLDIVNFILQSCTNVQANLQDLFRRVAFNICIANSDDHFRNHGFLLTSKGWTLSPAYDLNPTHSEYQSLLINSYSNQADLSLLLEASAFYMLDKDIALNIINEVIASVKEWRAIAKRLNIPKREIDLFATIFDSRCKI